MTFTKYFALFFSFQFTLPSCVKLVNQYAKLFRPKVSKTKVTGSFLAISLPILTFDRDIFMLVIHSFYLFLAGNLAIVVMMSS